MQLQLLLFLESVSIARFSSSTIKSCVLPKYPENGSYIVINDTNAGPGDAFDDLSLILYTSDEYFALEVFYLACARGAWNREIIKHVPMHFDMPHLGQKKKEGTTTFFAKSYPHRVNVFVNAVYPTHVLIVHLDDG
ncbi:hypothetical protein EVAR_76121_1 [Eumeta japonica]|uniref:Uncharacterized protein n=1 Tax=Eumeta variegata TaxID=151549 RepID=A0A4C2A5J0_EUMVA|nr:hypothetical protein EVAR_76121_1 [Eumeta japonica]